MTAPWLSRIRVLGLAGGHRLVTVARPRSAIAIHEVRDCVVAEARVLSAVGAHDSGVHVGSRWARLGVAIRRTLVRQGAPRALALAAAPPAAVRPEKELLRAGATARAEVEPRR